MEGNPRKYFIIGPVGISYTWFHVRIRKSFNRLISDVHSITKVKRCFIFLLNKKSHKNRSITEIRPHCIIIAQSLKQITSHNNRSIDISQQKGSIDQEDNTTSKNRKGVIRQEMHKYTQC